MATTRFQSGGAFLPGEPVNLTGDASNFVNPPTIGGSATVPGTSVVVGTTDSQTLTNKTFTNPTINGTAFATGQAPILCEKVALSGATIHAGVTAIKVFTGAAAMILRVVVDITTASSGASTLDCGYTAVSATTSSDTLLDGISGTPAAVFDSMNAALDSGANAKAQKAAADKWITIAEASGDATGLVGNAYIYYTLI